MHEFEFEFDAAMWVADAPADWRFVSLPENQADAIADLVGTASRGFGSVRVAVAIGATTWNTSIFPDRKRGTYILPVKKGVREKEGIDAPDVVAVRLELRD
jgi:hypothetical protein